MRRFGAGRRSGGRPIVAAPEGLLRRAGGGTEAPIEWPQRGPCPQPPMPRPGLGSSGCACSDLPEGQGLGDEGVGCSLAARLSRRRREVGRIDPAPAQGSERTRPHAAPLLDWTWDREKLVR